MTRARALLTIKGSRAWIPSTENLRRCGGIAIPSLGATVLPAHCVAGPVARTVSQNQGGPDSDPKFDVTYVRTNSKMGSHVYIAKQFFTGGIDMAVVFHEAPPDFGDSLQAVARVLSSNCVKPWNLSDAEQLIVYDVTSARPSGRGHYDDERKAIILSDVGYPGLSGSAVATANGRLAGMYTARMSSANVSAREDKVNYVIRSVLGEVCKITVLPNFGVNGRRLVQLYQILKDQALQQQRPHLEPREPEARQPPPPPLEKSEGDNSDVMKLLHAIHREVIANRKDVLDIVGANHKQVLERLDVVDHRLDIVDKRLDVVGANHDDLLRRRSLVLPLHDISCVAFEPWPLSGIKDVSGVTATHAFDQSTDCDYGLHL